jgi:hypothetical protein
MVVAVERRIFGRTKEMDPIIGLKMEFIGLKMN